MKMRGALLILQADGKSVKAFQFSHSGRKVRLLSFDECAVIDGRPDGEFLQDLAGKSFPAGVYLLFPSEEAVIKAFSFPLKDEEKISRILRFEAEKLLPYPAEEAVIDYTASGNRNSTGVLAAFARKQTLDFYGGIFRDSGISFRAVVPDIICLPELVESSAPFMAVLESGGVLKICIYKNGAPRLIRAFRLPAGSSSVEADIIKILEEEIPPLASSFSLREPGSVLEGVYTAGPNLCRADVERVVSEKLGLKASPLDAFKRVEHGGDGDSASSARGSVELAAGLALAVFSGKKLLNLKGRKEKKDRKGSPVLTVLLSVFILLLVFSSVFIRLKEKENHLDEIREEISRAVEHTFEAPELADRSGMEIISILRERSRLRGATADALRDIGRGRVLEILRELVLSLPDGGKLDITAVRIDGRECYLDGRAGTFRQAEEVFKSILGSGYFPDARMGRAQVDSERGGVVFRIDIALPEGG